MRSFFAIPLVFVVGNPLASAQSPVLIQVETRELPLTTVERTVLAPLERQLMGMDSIERIRGLALAGRAVIRLDSARDADPEIVRLMVRNRLALAKAALPPSCTPEILPEIARDCLLIAVESTEKTSLADCSIAVNEKVLPKLANVPGLAQIRVVGAARAAIYIAIDSERLQARRKTASDVGRAVRESLEEVDELVCMGRRVLLKNPKARPKFDAVGDVKLPASDKDRDRGVSVAVKDVAVAKDTQEWTETARISSRTGKDLTSRRAVFVLAHPSGGKFDLLARQGLEKALESLRGEFDGLRFQSRWLKEDTTTVVVRMPDAIHDAQREEKGQVAVNAVLEIPEVRKVYWFVEPGPADAVAWVVSDPGKKAETSKVLRAKLASIPGANSRIDARYSPLFPWPGEGAALTVRLYGNDYGKLQKHAAALRDRLAKTKRFVDVEQSPGMQDSAIIDIDREKVRGLGLTPYDIHRALADKIELPPLDAHFQLSVVDLREYADPKRIVEELRNLRVFVPGWTGPLRNLAAIEPTIVPKGVILHEGGQPCVVIFADPEGRTLEEARSEVRSITQELTEPGVRIVVE